MIKKIRNLLRTLGILYAIVAMLTVALLGSAMLYLWLTGRTNTEQLGKAVKVVRGEPAEVMIVEKEMIPEDLHDLVVDLRKRREEVQMQRADILNLGIRLNTERSQLDRDVTDFQRKKEEFDESASAFRAQLKQEENIRASQEFKDMVKMFKGLDPEVAATTILQFRLDVPAGQDNLDVDTIVRYLSALDPRIVGDILTEMQELTDPTAAGAAARLLRELDRLTQPRSPGPGTTGTSSTPTGATGGG